MSQVITAIYEHGTLRPLIPLKLREHQRIQVQLVQEPKEVQAQELLDWLCRVGRVTPPAQSSQRSPFSEEERRELAKMLGEAITKPLSEMILEERGER